MIEYIVVDANLMTDFIEQVNLKIQEGYTPLGGIACMHSPHTAETDTLFQAMTRPIPESYSFEK